MIMDYFNWQQKRSMLEFGGYTEKVDIIKTDMVKQSRQSGFNLDRHCNSTNTSLVPSVFSRLCCWATEFPPYYNLVVCLLEVFWFCSVHFWPALSSLVGSFTLIMITDKKWRWHFQTDSPNSLISQETMPFV
jgi:hypothetical protein